MNQKKDLGDFVTEEERENSFLSRLPESATKEGGSLIVAGGERKNGDLVVVGKRDGPSV